MINLNDFDDPESLDNDEKFQQNLIDFEVQNGHEARVFIERYITAQVFINSLKTEYQDDQDYFNEVFDNDPRVVRFMLATSILIANSIALVDVGTLPSLQASTFLSAIFKIGLILGMTVRLGPEDDEKLPDAFEEWMNTFNFGGPPIEDDLED